MISSESRPLNKITSQKCTFGSNCSPRSRWLLSRHYQSKPVDLVDTEECDKRRDWTRVTQAYHRQLIRLNYFFVQDNDTHHVTESSQDDHLVISPVSVFCFFTLESPSVMECALTQHSYVLDNGDEVPLFLGYFYWCKAFSVVKAFLVHNRNIDIWDDGVCSTITALTVWVCIMCVCSVSVSSSLISFVASTSTSRAARHTSHSTTDESSP